MVPELQRCFALQGSSWRPVPQVHGSHDCFVPELIRKMRCSGEQAPGDTDDRPEAPAQLSSSPEALTVVRLDLDA